MTEQSPAPGAASGSRLQSQRLRKRYKSRTVVQDVSLDVGSRRTRCSAA